MKAAINRGDLGFGGDPIDARESGTLMTAPQYFIERRLGAANHSLDAAVAEIAHPAVEAQGCSLLDQPITIADALDTPLDMDA